MLSAEASLDLVSEPLLAHHEEFFILAFPFPIKFFVRTVSISPGVSTATSGKIPIARATEVASLRVKRGSAG
jgi:hypothetical protein